MGKAIDEVMEGYKETEIGVLPEDWEVVRLREVFQVKQGKALSPKHRKGINPKPFLRTANVFWGRIDISVLDEMDFTDDEVEQLKLIPGDLLVCEGGDVGRTAIWNGEIDVCCYQNHLHRLRSKSENVYPLFYMYWMQAAFLLFQLYGGEGNKTTIPNLSQARLKAFVLPKPPFCEQRKIAHVLSTIQRAIELQDKIIAAARELKKSLMRHLFTYGPVPVDQIDRVPLKETEIGPVPEHWEVVNIGYVTTESYSGGTPSTKESAYWGGSIPWTTTALMGEEEIYLTTYQRLITERALNETSTRLAPKGSLLLGTRVGVGKAVIATFDIAVNQDITVLRLDTQKISPQFLAYGFKTDLVRESLRGKVRGTTIKGIPRNDLLTLCIPLPPLPEQRQIAHFLATVDQKIEAEEKRKAALQSLFQTMLHLLMTGKVRVKDLEVNVDAPGR
jgi:type I restriction enzyme S subunit